MMISADSSCEACGAVVDERHASDCPVWLDQINQPETLDTDDWDRLMGLVAELEQRVATVERQLYEAEKKYCEGPQWGYVVGQKSFPQ